ncbi:MAG: hypothetical protein IJO28_00330 [Oscillospiraceae bacterium]|nr:hypothetical protein [Oscillospiraceae bacterium]
MKEKDVLTRSKRQGYVFLVPCLIFVLIFVLLLCSCAPRQYTFPNKGQPVVSIELLYNPHANKNVIGGPMESIRFLQKEEVDTFLQALYTIETHRCITPPPTDYGFYVARVVYENGDIEIFGSRHIEFIEKGQEPAGIGGYCLTPEDFKELFFEYAGPCADLYPEPF